MKNISGARIREFWLREEFCSSWKEIIWEDSIDQNEFLVHILQPFLVINWTNLWKKTKRQDNLRRRMKVLLVNLFGPKTVFTLEL